MLGEIEVFMENKWKQFVVELKAIISFKSNLVDDLQIISDFYFFAI